MIPTIRLDRLLGRCVVAANNRRVGRIEECRGEMHGTGWVVASYVIGTAGLWERLHVGAGLLFGRDSRSGYVARWDQLDVSDPDVPRLRCPIDDLERR